MHIKEVIIDGFKSYANRTVISGWDREFNAITGLNGSGKSNILDAICFVLGISNLSHVRCNNLQELIYKKGQSRVTKASVTIVFDNSDKNGSPVSYEQYNEITVTRQIVVGGRNKYMINGRTAQLSRVKNLFHSVQLNVNNPHFLIMQGRITKVVNMKPPELLGMLEEAAGTRMYETKKNSAMKTIIKKQAKVDEINKVITEEITPQLDKYKKERANYLQWSANNTEIDRLTRYLIAYEYYQAMIMQQNGKEIESKCLEHKKELEYSIDDYKIELENVQQEVNKLKIQQEEFINQSYQNLLNNAEEQNKNVVRYQSMVQNKQNEINKLNDKIKKDVNQLKLSKLIDKKQEEIIDLKTDATNKMNEYNELTDEINAMKGQLLGFFIIIIIIIIIIITKRFISITINEYTTYDY